MLYNRNPVTGDKFSSRHGQKGVLSFGWPDENMPFVGSTGMRPDIIINPHAFPSRMTIGMLVESIAAKSACLDGRFVDATPFKSSTVAGEPGPVETFGDALGAHGFSRLGGESMICGTSGVEFQVDIFIGVVYYQRLRVCIAVCSALLFSFRLTRAQHMVSDKFQVRSVGARARFTILGKLSRLTRASICRAYQCSDAPARKRSQGWRRYPRGRDGEGTYWAARNWQTEVSNLCLRAAGRAARPRRRLSPPGPTARVLGQSGHGGLHRVRFATGCVGELGLRCVRGQQDGRLQGRSPVCLAPAVLRARRDGDIAEGCGGLTGRRLLLHAQCRWRGPYQTKTLSLIS